MSEARVLVEITGGVATVTLNRPRARNALDTGTIQELSDQLHRLASDSSINACILTGAGPAFCAGADLKQRLHMSAAEQVAHTQSIFHCSDLLETLPIPIIAAINGPAYAGGLELAIACDVRIAADGATFAFPEVTLGIFPGAGGPIRVQRLVGEGWARLMIFSGESIGAAEALRIGLVERVTTGEGLMEEARTLASRIARNSAAGVRSAKTLMNAAGEMSFAAASALSEALRSPLSGTPESVEGLERFSGSSH
jgi:enoyl-CoA hydratase/carnithine racemase